MKITVNGVECEYQGLATLAALLEAQGAISEQVAVMVNDQIISRAQRSALILKDADRIEIISFCGGG